MPELWETVDHKMMAQPQTFRTDASFHGTKGVLSFDGGLLTFSYNSGFLVKHERVPVSIPANMILGASVEGAVFKKLIVRTSQKNVIPRYEFQVSEPHQWASWLSNAIHHAIREEQKIVSEVIREVKVLVRCSHCGFHVEQGMLSCPTCGGPL